MESAFRYGTLPIIVVTQAAYTYTGLHQRATRRAAAKTIIGLATNDLGNLYYYDSAWRLCEERSATHWDGSAEFTAVKITQRIWCPLYIDALIATQTDTSGADPGPGADGDFTDAIFENTLYAVCDRKYDVIAMTDADGILKERTDYSPYGVARHRPPADLNGDGKIDGVDQLIFFNAWGAPFGSAAYSPDADINSDGQVNGSDFLILSNAFGADPAPPGAISKLGNTVGYSGYIYDDDIGLSLARFRWYDAETGRWTTRDPAGYIDGSNWYQYIISAPLNATDPNGLSGPARHAPNHLPRENPYLRPGGRQRYYEGFYFDPFRFERQIHRELDLWRVRSPFSPANHNSPLYHLDDESLKEWQRKWIERIVDSRRESTQCQQHGPTLPMIGAPGNTIRCWECHQAAQRIEEYVDRKNRERDWQTSPMRLGPMRNTLFEILIWQ